MLPLSETPCGALSARRCSFSSSPAIKFIDPNPRLLSNRRFKFISRRNPDKSLNLALVKAEGNVDSTKQVLSGSPSPSPPPFPNDRIVFVGDKNVPLEGVIQFDKPNSSSSRLDKWGRVALLSGGDVLALLLFSAIGRFSHGFSVFDIETLRTADPFIAGWFLSAYFLGGYGEDGRGMKGQSKALAAAAKSWALGIPLGVLIRAVISGHIPAYNFVAVTLGSTAFLLIGWRAMIYKLLPNGEGKKNDVYRKGSSFELFELLVSLVRRW